jgi:4'-phosphopantetheinyl transferase EntD
VAPGRGTLPRVTAPLPILPALFGSAVVTEEVDLFSATLSELLSDEAEAIKSARGERLLEFRGGRHCARLALGRLGLVGAPVLRAPDRAPLWPPGFVGSIAHTRNRERGFCGVAVARASEVRSVGLDVELDTPLERALWRRVFTERERGRIEQEPEPAQGFLGKLVFSAKECAYKCQYPLSRAFLEFQDVEVTISLERGELSAVLLREAGPFRAGSVFAGRFAREGGIIATGITLV